MTALTLTINGRRHGPTEVRDDLSMNDFLREVLGMTGTKFGCGAAQCLSCAVIVDDPDGTSHTRPTCVAPATAFQPGTSCRRSQASRMLPVTSCAAMRFGMLG